MNRKKFTEQIVKTRLAKIAIKLSEKADEYAVDKADKDNSNAFHNFDVAARMNDESPEKALWGMATKHLVSVKDMVDGNVEITYDIVEEKIGDMINYLILLEGVFKRKLKK